MQMPGAATASCPKHMVMGPCGGVRADGSCEVRPHPCAFPAPPPWADPVPPVPLRAAPLILTDFSSEPYSLPMLTSVAAALAPSCDAVLVGEHQDRPDFPPTLHASLLRDAGVRPWLTLACRDRNRIVLEQELRGLRHVGVDAVLCVTGDARAYDVRPDVTQVFDLDGTRLAALAASVGLSAAVAETVTAPPRHLRAVRLARKQRAGAAVAVLNHAAVASVTEFMAAADPVEAGLAAEFDTVAEWTAQVAEALGPEYFIPAGCRGSGQPSALDWLLDRLRPAAGEVLIDVGAGVGGPAAYAAERTGVRPVLLEPEPGACRAAVRLFGAPVARADAIALPEPDASASLLWSLGVLCTQATLENQLAMLLQLRRVLRPGGRIGLLVYLATTPRLDDPPQGNLFPADGQLNELLGRADLQVLSQADAGDLPPPPADWQDRTAAVERELQRRFGHTPQLSAASEQSDRIGRLLSSGQLTCQVLILRGRTR